MNRPSVYLCPLPLEHLSHLPHHPIPLGCYQALVSYGDTTLDASDLRSETFLILQYSTLKSTAVPATSLLLLHLLLDMPGLK